MSKRPIETPSPPKKRVLRSGMKDIVRSKRDKRAALESPSVARKKLPNQETMVSSAHNPSSETSFTTQVDTIQTIELRQLEKQKTVASNQPITDAMNEMLDTFGLERNTNFDLSNNQTSSQTVSIETMASTSGVERSLNTSQTQDLSQPKRNVTTTITSNTSEETRVGLQSQDESNAPSENTLDETTILTQFDTSQTKDLSQQKRNVTSTITSDASEETHVAPLNQDEFTNSSENSLIDSSIGTQVNSSQTNTRTSSQTVSIETMASTSGVKRSLNTKSLSELFSRMQKSCGNNEPGHQTSIVSSDESDNDEPVSGLTEENERNQHEVEENATNDAVELPEVQVIWQLEKTFLNAQEIQQFIDNENTWRKGKKTQLKKGLKQEYHCNKVKTRGPQCAAGCYTISNSEPNSPEVKFYRKNLAHNHDDLANQVFKVSEQTKKIITDLLDNGETKGSIMFKIRKMDLDAQPRDKQIQSIITDYQRKKFGSKKADILDFVDFYEKNKETPANQDQGFVIDFQRSEPDADDRWIRMMFSTVRLLKMSLDAECIHADSTYKLNALNYPLIVIGSTDKARHFHLIGFVLTKHETHSDFAFAFAAIKNMSMKLFGKTTIPRAVISDAAPAIFNGYEEIFDHPTARIMCWFHVKYNVRKYKFRCQENRKLVNRDLNQMHILYDEKIFDEAAKWFVVKWKTEEVEFMQKFENSFLKQNKYWFLGASDQTPIHNNAMEGFNSSIKVLQTHWERKPIAEFKVRLLEMVAERSTAYVMDKDSFEHTVPVTREMQTKGYEYSLSGKQFHIIQANDFCKCYVFANANAHFQINDKDVDGYLKTDWTAFETFDKLTEAALAMHCVTFDTVSNDWRDAKCTCPSYGKLYVCKHILAMCYRLTILPRPGFIPEYLEANPKRGPKAKAKKGLSRD